jgi:autotransporter translocation and assembly factor TamB
VGEDDEQAKRPSRYRWVRWVLIVLGVFLLTLIVFHAPILRAIIRSVAQSYASGQNLKLEFRLEGDPVDEIALYNLHATATGPSVIRSLEADSVTVDYSLWDLIVHGASDTLKNVEVHDLTAVIDSSKAPVPTPTPTPAKEQQFRLPAYFPDRLVASNLNLTIKGKPQDMVIKDLNIGLYPDREGKLQIAKVQIPGVDTWTDIHGTTTYANKNLYIHNLRLDQNSHFESVNVNASKIGEGKLAIGLKGTVGGGEVNTQTEISTAGRATSANTNLHVKDISLGKLARYVGKSPGQLSGQVKNVDLDLSGDLNRPASWNGSINASLQNVRQGAFKLDQVKLNAEARNGQATIREGRIQQGNNQIEFQGAINLPETTGGFAKTPANLGFSVNAPNLEQLTSFMETPASGSLQAKGNLTTEADTMKVTAHATGEQVHYQNAAIGNLAADLQAEKKMRPPNEKKPASIYQGVTSNIHLQMNDVRYGDFAIGDMQGDLRSNGPNVTLGPLVVQNGNNTLHLNGTVQLPGPDEKLMNQPADVRFKLNAPQLADFWQSDVSSKVTGSLQGDGEVQVRNGVANGQIALTGQQIAAQNLVVRQLNLQAAITNDVLHLKDLTATINDQDYLHAEGDVHLQKPYQYKARATAHLADLSAFEPVLNAGKSGSKTHLAGSFVLDWNGQGDLTTIPHRGDLNLRIENGRYNDLRNLSMRVEAHYTEQQLDVPIVYLGSDKVNLQATLQAQNAKVQVSNLQISQAASKYATGYVEIPFNWSNLGTGKRLFPPDGNVQVTFNSENLDIAKLSRDLGIKPPVTGQVSLNLDAHGPLDRLEAALNLKLQNLEAAAMKRLRPAAINIAMRLQNDQLTVNGTINQPQVQPVQIAAQLPLNISNVLAQRQLPPSTPIQARVTMPRSPINFIREFVPGLRQLDGNLGLNVNVDGTVANPTFSGATEMHINVARFENATLPALHDFNANLAFSGNELRIQRFGGNIAGGPFNVSGGIRFPSLTKPTLDLRLRANSVLVARNDDLTVRADADVTVTGPFDAATVKGNVATTNSRFFKNIDIIPITLPGRPAPHPEPPSAAPSLSFPDPPLRDWKFDLAIKSKEPFLIRGNLATGRAIIDMKLTGTGLHPRLEGQVRLENFDATLPFSTLSITLGFVYFTPDDPLNPRLELQGVSLVRDYTIHAYIYGTANAPRAVFSSEPPLPQEEIISLLATGTTREELSSGNVLASRAAILLVKQVYRKIFKKDQPAETNENSFFSRLDVEFGNTDPRTGEQTATARYKVSDRWVLIGDLGVQGGFRGLVKYLIRFR